MKEKIWKVWSKHLLLSAEKKIAILIARAILFALCDDLKNEILSSNENNLK